MTLLRDVARAVNDSRAGSAARRVLPEPIWRRVAAAAGGRLPEPIDTAPLALLRDADPAQLEDLLPQLGLADDVPHVLPDHLQPHVGKGLRHWQYPNQFAPYLALLSSLPIRSYLEVGVRHGGTFLITTEVLKPERAVAVDIDRVPAPEHANVIALHDIVDDASPGVRRTWAELRADGPSEFAFHEFTAQYPEVVERVGTNVLGIGVAVRRDWRGQRHREHHDDRTDRCALQQARGESCAVRRIAQRPARGGPPPLAASTTLPPHPDDLPRAALALLLAVHPAQLSLDELERELARPPHEVTDAVAELAAAGLLHLHGRFVFPTRAAVRAHELSA